MITLKSGAELDRMRMAGSIVAEALAAMSAHAAPGVRTREFDEIARDIFASHDATPSFLGYPSPSAGVESFPAVVTVSINEEVVHGIPGDREVVDGDLVSLDCGCIWQGYHGDAAVTVAVGTVADETLRLMEITRGALMRGIAGFVPGGWLWDAISAIQEHVEANGFSVVKQYQGHGIGRQMHEAPSVPNFIGQPRPKNMRLQPGLTVALEPMVTAGKWQTKTLDDGWTVVTVDNALSCHFEHTIAVTEDGPEILTKQRDN